MVSTDIRSETQAAQDRRDANTVPQFFISVVNQCAVPLTLSALAASAGCGWVQEPVLGQQIVAGDERVWCGMPWDAGTPLDLALTLQCPLGEIRLTLTREIGLEAHGEVSVHGDATLCARAELQRGDIASPFLMVVVHTI